MFWPDDASLGSHDWWNWEIWPSGPTYGETVRALRPVLRVATLHGYQVDAICFGYRQGTALDNDWERIVLDTLALEPGEGPSPDLPGEAFTVWLNVSAVVDLTDEIDGDYGTGLLPTAIFGLDTKPEHPAVPAELIAAFAAYTDGAIGSLVRTAVRHNKPVRENGGGLAWILDSAHWQGLSDMGKRWYFPLLGGFTHDATPLLTGIVTNDCTAFDAIDSSGPASLAILIGRADLFMDELAASLQAAGEAARLGVKDRSRLRMRYGPNWLDALTGLLLRGALVIEGLFEPGDPPEAIAAQETAANEADGVTAITLSVWDGDATVFLSRETTFLDQAKPGLARSVAWDYVPGDDQTRPAVLVVAGRGVQVLVSDRGVPDLPFDINVYRVQDDAGVPPCGSAILTEQLLAGSTIEPYDDEIPQPPTDETMGSFPRVFVKPKPDGVILVYPVSSATTADTLEEVGSDAWDTPYVLELTVPVHSGTAAYSIDINYFADGQMNIPMGGPFNGGAHISVWTSADVEIRTNWAEINRAECVPGSPSAVSATFSGHLLVAEFWRTSHPELLGRPWHVALPLTPWSTLFPPTVWTRFLQAVWIVMAPQSLQDLMGNASYPFEADRPALVYDTGAQHSIYNWGGKNVTLTPAPYGYRFFPAFDSMLLDAADVGVSLIPFVGDLVDIGEAQWAWQTGMDKWGRPLTNFQLAMMMFGAAVPVISGEFLRHGAELVGDLVNAAPVGELTRLPTPAEVGRLSGPAYWGADLPMTQVDAAMQETSAVRRLGTDVSPATRELSLAGVDELRRNPALVQSLVQRLLAGQLHGWLGPADILTEDPAFGFILTPLENNYLRHIRKNGYIPPLQYLDLA